MDTQSKIKNGIGYKSVTKYRRGKKVGSVKMPVHLEHIKVIRGGKFIKGLFDDCKNCKKNKTRKNRK